MLGPLRLRTAPIPLPQSFNRRLKGRTLIITALIAAWAAANAAIIGAGGIRYEAS